MSGRPTVGSLFSGIGGFDIALERAGFRVVWQAENDPFCNRVLAHHWPEVYRYTDVRDITAESLQALFGREATDGLPQAAERADGPSLMVRSVRERLLQGEASASDTAEPPPLESQSPIRPHPPGIQRDEDCPEEPLRDLRSSNGKAEGGSRPRDREGAGPPLSPMQSPSERPGGQQLQGEGPDLSSAFPDVICGGFPCQDLSVAGKRGGLHAERSGLFFEFMRIIRSIREASGGRFPKLALIENVPGLHSSSSGRDFGILLNALAECGAVDIGWRIIDSQHWVPQRRRRVFIVAVFPPASDGHSPIGRAAEILSLIQSCGGHPQTRRAPGEGVAASLAASAHRPGLKRDEQASLVLANTLRAQPDASHRADTDTYVGFSSTGAGYWDAGLPRLSAHDAKQSEGTLLALAAEPGMKQQNYIAGGPSVRRLTPTECARLQGFPDDWLDLPGAADGPKYKALGNAVTVPVIEYLGLRIIALIGDD